MQITTKITQTYDLLKSAIAQSNGFSFLLTIQYVQCPLGVDNSGNLKLDFMAKSIGIHFFELKDMFRCFRDNENLKKHFGHMDTLKLLTL